MGRVRIMLLSHHFAPLKYEGHIEQFENFEISPTPLVTGDCGSFEVSSEVEKALQPNLYFSPDCVVTTAESVQKRMAHKPSLVPTSDTIMNVEAKPVARPRDSGWKKHWLWLALGGALIYYNQSNSQHTNSAESPVDLPGL